MVLPEQVDEPESGQIKKSSGESQRIICDRQAEVAEPCLRELIA